MSVVNLLVLPDRVHAFTDTMQYQDGKPAGLMGPKAVASDNGRFTIITRGLTDAGRVVTDFVRSAPDLHHAEGAAAAIMNEARKVKAKRPDMRVEVTLIGEHGGAMRVSRFLLPEHGTDVRFSILAPGLYLEPAPPGLVLAAPVDRVHERLVKLALVQQAVAVKHGFTMCIGGVLHCTEVDRTGMRQSIAAVYPGYDQHAARFGDPCAEAVYVFRERLAA